MISKSFFTNSDVDVKEFHEECGRLRKRERPKRTTHPLLKLYLNKSFKATTSTKKLSPFSLVLLTKRTRSDQKK